MEGPVPDGEQACACSARRGGGHHRGPCDRRPPVDRRHPLRARRRSARGPRVFDGSQRVLRRPSARLSVPRRAKPRGTGPARSSGRRRPLRARPKPAGPRSSPSSRRPAPVSRPATWMASAPRCRRSVGTSSGPRSTGAIRYGSRRMHWRWTSPPPRAGRSETRRGAVPGVFAAALLVLEPSSELAVALGARARTGAELNAKLGEAKDAAQRGKWRAALRLALAVVAIQKDFPGAAAVVADARDALAPKPRPSPQRRSRRRPRRRRPHRRRPAAGRRPRRLLNLLRRDASRDSSRPRPHQHAHGAGRLPRPALRRHGLGGRRHDAVVPGGPAVGRLVGRQRRLRLRRHGPGRRG